MLKKTNISLLTHVRLLCLEGDKADSIHCERKTAITKKAVMTNSSDSFWTGIIALTAALTKGSGAMTSTITSLRQ